MNTEMSDQEKSVMLAKLCGWEAMCPNLYDPGCMALAWRVLNWALSNDGPVFFRMADWLFAESQDTPDGYKTGGANWFRLLMHQPAAAQRAWLDMVLTLATEAGMVTK